MKKVLMIMSVFILLAILPAFTGQMIAGAETSDAVANVKVVVGKGQTLSHIAWKYTGYADNWMAIAKASGLKTDLKSQRRIFVGTVLVIPQSLLKYKLTPEPSADAFSLRANAVRVYEDDIVAAQKQIKGLEQQIMYWKLVVGALSIVFVLTLIAWISSSVKLNQKNKDLEKVNNDWARANAAAVFKDVMAFKTQEGEVIITKVSKVLCPACDTEVNPKNLLSHYFQQHEKAR